MSHAEAIDRRARPILERLVAFDTTSRASNLDLIAWVEAYLADLDIASHRIANAAGDKANLLAVIGPAQTPGGFILSGLTDVVPVDGQAWTSDPWALVERDGRLFGRGACDMKGFLALALAALPTALAAPLARPLALAFSYDEEVGCFGAPSMIQAMPNHMATPNVVIIGEPTSMQVVQGHKGISVFNVEVRGIEAHSGLTHLGLSANMVAVRLMDHLVRLADQLEAQGDADESSRFLPKGATLTIGTIVGGTAGNILARDCRFQFDLRTLPDMDPKTVLAPFMAAAADLDAQIKTRFAQAGVTVTQAADVPALRPPTNDRAETVVRSLAGDNGPSRVVSYAAEAGQFQLGGYDAVLCGPGSIDQAHQPDEYVEVAQMQRGAAFMARLIEALR